MNDSELVLAIARTLLCTAGVVVLAGSVGITLGGLAGTRGGFYNELLRRLVEFSGALPVFVAIPLLAQVTLPGASVVLVLGGYHGLRLACLCRNETRAVSGEPFVLAAKALGLGTAKTHRIHVIPALLPALSVGLLLVLPGVIAIEAALKYLGLEAAPTVGGYLITQAGLANVVATGACVVLPLGLQQLAESSLARFLRCERG